MSTVYVTSTEWLNEDRPPELYIRTEPDRTNMSHEQLIIGDLGTTNNRSSYAHGKFASIETARQYIKNSWPGAVAYDPATEGEEQFADDGETNVLVGMYKLHRIVYGEFVNYDRDAADVYDAFSALDPGDYLVSIDPGETSIDNNLLEALLAHLGTDAPDPEDYRYPSQFLQALQVARYETWMVEYLQAEGYTVQVVKDIPSTFYIIARKK